MAFTDVVPSTFSNVVVGRIRTSHAAGTLFRVAGSGDFLVVRILAGFLYTQFNVGGGVVTLQVGVRSCGVWNPKLCLSIILAASTQSSIRLDDGAVHSFVADLTGRDLTVQVDDQIPQTASSAGAAFGTRSIACSARSAHSCDHYLSTSHSPHSTERGPRPVCWSWFCWQHLRAEIQRRGSAYGGMARAGRVFEVRRKRARE